MQPTPIYQPANLNPAYQLRFSWTGFPARGTRFPANLSLDEMENLHVVLMTCERYRMGAKETAPAVRDTCRAVAAKHEYGISTFSVMPDHLHIAMRGNLAHSPEQIALRFQNNTAWKLGQVKVWEHNYYAGTFGEYTMHAVRS